MNSLNNNNINKDSNPDKIVKINQNKIIIIIMIMKMEKEIIINNKYNNNLYYNNKYFNNNCYSNNCNKKKNKSQEQQIKYSKN